MTLIAPYSCLYLYLSIVYTIPMTYSCLILCVSMPLVADCMSLIEVSLAYNTCNSFFWLLASSLLS